MNSHMDPAVYKPETEALRRAREFIESTDPMLTTLAALFKEIGERGSMDDLFAIAKIIDMFITETQSRIALRN